MEKIAVAFVVVSVILIAFLGVYVPIFGFNYETGSGSQVGYVSAIEKDGIFFKTDTVYIKPELESTQEDYYCVIDESLVAQLIEASRSKNRIEVKHKSLLSAGIKNCSGEGAIITNVQVLQ